MLLKVAPPYLQGLFQYFTYVTGHHIRNLNHLYIPQVRTNYGRQLLYLLEELCYEIIHLHHYILQAA